MQHSQHTDLESLFYSVLGAVSDGKALRWAHTVGSDFHFDVLWSSMTVK